MGATVTRRRLAKRCRPGRDTMTDPATPAPPPPALAANPPPRIGGVGGISYRRRRRRMTFVATWPNLGLHAQRCIYTRVDVKKER